MVAGEVGEASRVATREFPKASVVVASNIRRCA